MSDSEESLDPRATLDIQNVVVSSSIDQEIDLKSVAIDLHGADYDPDNFPGLIYRMDDPRGTVLLFRSGKIVATGIQSPDAVEPVLESVFDELSNLGLDVPDDPPITIQNIVADAEFGQGLNLNAIAIGLGLEAVEYEPEQFPGLVYRVEDPSVVVLLFGSGKLVVTGATTRDEAEHGINVVESRLDDLGLLA